MQQQLFTNSTVPFLHRAHSTRCLYSKSLSSRYAARHRLPVSISAVLTRAPETTFGLSRTLSDIAGVDLSDPVPEIELRDAKDVSYVSRRRLDAADFDPNEIDAEGLPLVYNEQKIADFWKNKPGELAGRWAKFAGIAAPWLAKLANAVITGNLEQRQVQLARDAVKNLEQLGPTFIKLGQILSIRPDVLPAPVMTELAALQDNMPTFPTREARAMVEQELGRPIDQVFSFFSDRPVAAASLAQVYRARLRSTGEEVAVKVQRPGALSTISKDLYVMRRGIGIYERLIRRFTAQTTDYQRLLSTFAEGLYTEMDFRNESLNSIRMQQLLDSCDTPKAKEMIIPKVYLDLTTRRVLTMEWLTGVKLTTLPPAEIRRLVGIGQEAFLVQLLEVGYLHGDPHPGNLLKITEGPHAGRLALLDFGLVAEVPAADREAMISATIHLANRNWDGLITDFVKLNFLPANADRGLIIPVMDRVLSPYLKGGGAKSFNFQALSQDLLKTTMQIPFSVPPYMSLLARSVATLEGIALMGDPDYQMVAQAYPFVVRRVLRTSQGSSALLLRDIVYDANGKVKPTRLSGLLNAALGRVADDVDGFVDLDAVPAEGASLQEIFAFLLSDDARDLRPLLIRELISGLDLYTRSTVRRAVASLPSLAPRLPFMGAVRLPQIPLPSPPVYVPGLGLRSATEAVEMFAPELAQGEEVHLQTLMELAASSLGVHPSELQSPILSTALQFLVNPSAQAQEVRQALAILSGSPANSQIVRDTAVNVVNGLMAKQAERVGVPPSTLFPALSTMMQNIR